MTTRVASPVRRGPLDGLAPLTGAELTISALAPLDKAIARGIGGPDTAGRVIEAGSFATWHLGPDEAIVISPPDAGAEVARGIAAARSSVDVSSGYAALRVAGPEARSLLAAACPVDVSERALPDRRIVQGNVANVRVVLARMDVDGAPAFTLLVARDEARYLWDALSELAGLGSGGHA